VKSILQRARGLFPLMSRKAKNVQYFGETKTPPRGGVWCLLLSLQLNYLRSVALSLEALSAVNRLVAFGLKRNFRLRAALGTSGGIHLPRTAVETSTATTGPLGLAARRTTSGRVSVTFLLVELLLTAGPHEGRSAVFAS